MFPPAHSQSRVSLSLSNVANERHIPFVHAKCEVMQAIADDFQTAVISSSIVSRADATGIITFVNRNFERISGYSEAELIGENHRIINSGYHPKTFWVDMWKTIAAGKIWRGEVKNRAKDGSYYWVDTFIMPFVDDHGKVREYLSIRNDITKRKSQEEEIVSLNNSLANFQNAITGSSIVSKADKKGNITYVNENFSTISGYSQAELVDRNHRIINSSHHPKSFWSDMWKTIASGKTWRADVKNKAKDGTYYWVDTFVYPVYDEHCGLVEYLSIRNDITQRKIQEELLAKNEQHLLNSLHEKEALVKEIHHRVKNNLQLISSMFYLKSLSPENGATTEFMSTMRQKIKSVSLIHERLLQSKSLNSVDIQDYLVKLVNDISVTGNIISRNISIQCNIQQLFFNTDQATYIGQLVNELILNALKHAFVHDTEGHIDVTLQANESGCDLTIRDNGVGLPAGLDPHKSDSYGMQLIHVFIQQLKGTWAVNSANGTAFHFHFPYTQIHTHAAK